MMKQGVTLFIVLMVTGTGLVGFGSVPDGGVVEIPNPRDSLKLERYIEWARDSIEEALDLEFDSNHNFRHTVESGSYFTSPDDMFTIFVIDYEFCHHYCIPRYISILELNKGREAIHEGDFMPVKGIIKMPDGKYLVLQEGTGRLTHCAFDEYVKATLLSFNEGGPVYHSIPYKHPIYGDDLISGPSLELSQEHFILNESYINYDSQKMRLNYQYATNKNGYSCEMDSAYIFQGYFEYINGQFIHKQETREYLGSEADFEEEE